MSKTTRGFIYFGILVLVVAFLCIGPAFFWLPSAGKGVGLPAIVLPGELLGKIGSIPLTNTFTSLAVVDLIIVLIVVTAVRATSNKRPEDYVPRGFMNFLEILVEFMYNQAKNLLGDKTMWVFPVAMSIFLFLLIGNWVKLIPGYETVGTMVCADPGAPGYGLAGYTAGQSGILTLNVNSLDLKGRAGHKVTPDDVAACEAKYPSFKSPAAIDAEANGTAATGTAPNPANADSNEQFFNIVPYFRAMATDLNLPLALAIIVVLLVQYWGIRALGPAYFFKFINIPALGNIGQNPMGAMDFVVGLVEIISELSRLVSLSFRLFGNIFAGGVLLTVMSFLIGGVLPVPFYFLELFAGLIQSYVFAVLTIIYASQAVTSHHAEEHEAEHETHGHGDEVHVTSAQLP